jgi:hypothetical protein
MKETSSFEGRSPANGTNTHAYDVKTILFANTIRIEKTEYTNADKIRWLNVAICAID